jgi:hypothetical protein
MTALLEFECQVPVGGYEVITDEQPVMHPKDEIFRLLRARSKRTRRFDLFKVSSSAFLEFAQTPLTEDGFKDFADRYGPLDGPPAYGGLIVEWSIHIREMHRTVELWKMSNMTGDFSKVIRDFSKRIRTTVHDLADPHNYPARPAVPVGLFLKKDPLSASARLCIRPHSLVHALWVQLLMAIDGNVNLGACVQCRKWFTLEAGRGRSDKEYCSNACRMRAYRKRKVNG